MSFAYTAVTESLRMQLAPYWNAVRIACYMLIIGAAITSGCSVQKKLDENKVEEAIQGRAEAVATYNRLVEDVRQGNEKTRAAKDRADKLAEENKKLAKEAEARKRALVKAEKDFAKKLASAKKDPECAELLEMKLCEAISDY